MGRRSYLVLGVFLLLGALGVRAQDQPEVHEQPETRDQPDVRLEKDAFFARGKWNPTDGKPGTDFALLPMVEIHCFKNQNYCMQAIASVHDGRPGLAIQYYHVAHWDKNNLVAENDDFSCTTNQLKIDIKEEIVLAVDSPKHKGRSAADKGKPSADRGKASTDPCTEIGHAITFKLVGETSDVPMQPSASPPTP